MKYITLIPVILLAGCAGITPFGVSPGSSKYVVEWENGVPKRAEAEVANESKHVEMTMSKDGGITFVKDDTRSTGSEAAVATQADVIKALIPLVPRR